MIEEAATQTAFAGDYVSVTISHYDQQNMAVGYVLCDPLSPVPTATKFEARIVVFNVTVPITRGFPVVIIFIFFITSLTVIYCIILFLIKDL